MYKVVNFCGKYDEIKVSNITKREETDKNVISANNSSNRFLDIRYLVHMIVHNQM
jgi:hypothetical protein